MRVRGREEGWDSAACCEIKDEEGVLEVDSEPEASVVVQWAQGPRGTSLVEAERWQVSEAGLEFVMDHVPGK
jgi:hypothetical protein